MREGVADEDVLRGQNSEHVSNVAFEVAKQAKVILKILASCRCTPVRLACFKHRHAAHLKPAHWSCPLVISAQDMHYALPRRQA